MAASRRRERRETWRAPARGRWRSRTASTSATRGGRRSSSSSARRSAAWREACEALGTPVTGGNVSLYNESPNGAVYPDAGHRHGGPRRMTSTTSPARRSGRRAMPSSCSASPPSELGAQRVPGAHPRRHGRRAAARATSHAERRLIDALLDAIQAGQCHRRTTAATAVSRSRSRNARWQTASRRSAPPSISRRGRRSPGARCFSAKHRDGSSSRPIRRPTSKELPAKHGVPARRIGVVESADRPFRIQYHGGELVAPVEQLAHAYHDAIPSIMTRVAVADDALAADVPSTVAS